MSFLNIFRRKRPEITVLDLLDKHLSLCVKTSYHLLVAVTEKIKDHSDQSNKHITTISETEEEADNVRREIINTLATGILPPLSKEDMMQLINRLDKVADWSKEAGRILGIIDMNEITQKLKQLILEQTKLAYQCTQGLSHVVSTLYIDQKNALDLCNLVEIIEHEMDIKYIEILSEIYTSAPDPSLIFLLKELTHTIEMLGDSCEDTADLIRVVVVSTFH